MSVVEHLSSLSFAAKTSSVWAPELTTLASKLTSAKLTSAKLTAADLIAEA